MKKRRTSRSRSRSSVVTKSLLKPKMGGYVFVPLFAVINKQTTKSIHNSILCLSSHVCVHHPRLWQWRTETSSRWTLLSMTWLKTWPCWHTSMRPLYCTTCADVTPPGWSMWVPHHGLMVLPLSRVSMLPPEVSWSSTLNNTIQLWAWAVSTCEWYLVSLTWGDRR